MTASPRESVVHCPWCNREFAPEKTRKRRDRFGEEQLGNEWKATVTMALVAGAIVAFVAQFVVSIIRINLLQELDEALERQLVMPFNIPGDLEARLGHWQDVGEQVMTVAVVVAGLAGIAFLVWLDHAVGNLHLLETTGLAFDRTGTVLSFFIPILNLFQPHASMQEICQASDPLHAQTRTAWKSSPSLRSVTVWWLSLLAAGLLAGLGVLASNDDHHMEGILYLLCGVDIALTISGSALLYVIFTVEQRQRQRYEMLNDEDQ